MVSVSFKKDLDKACTDLSFRARYKKSLPGSGGEISFHIEEPAFGKVEVVVQTDIETGLVPVFGDSYFIRIHVQKSHIHIELWFPTPQFGRGVETNAVIMGCRNGLCGK